MSQARDKSLTITVTTNTGDNLQGQAITIIQTDYSLTYETFVLDANGQCTANVYSGNHSVTVERAGYETVIKTFTVAEDATTTEVSVALIEKTRTPFALTAELDHNVYTGQNNVLLTWNTEPPVFFDDFESYEAFSTIFGEWTGIDGDNLAAASLAGDYPNRGVMQYAQIINPLTVSPPWWYDYPVLRPYSGQQYAGFTRTSSGEANDDWLISPAFTVGNENFITFMGKAADQYTERFMVYVTTQTDNPVQSDFIRIDQGNYETADYMKWKQYSYDISAYAGKQIRFAIRYINSANKHGAFMLMVDDVSVGQIQETSSPTKPHAKRMTTKSPANPNETFDVYNNGTMVDTTDGYSYMFNNLAAGTYTLGVKAKYKATESELVTTTITIPSDGYAHVTFHVTANSILTVDGQKINLVNTITTESYEITVSDGNAEIASLPNGEYIVNIEEGAFNSYQQTLSISGDEIIDIILTDRVLNPYNISADVTSQGDGTSTAIIKWNQDLMFTDSFEDYDDFATGSFGNWTTIDNDNKPVYPISLNGNIITFPGSGTQNSPKAVAPMVFNPWNTVPAMLPTDGAMNAPTGEKYIIFFSPQQAQADKWLISPEMTIRENYCMSVTAKSYTSTYPETLEFCVSTDGENPVNFSVLTKAQNMPSDQWMVYTTDLAAYAGQKVRLGIHYTSYDTFFAQMDDFTVGPENGGEAYIDYGNVVRYNIYLDGAKVGESTTPTYTLTGLTTGTHTVGIQAIYLDAQSEIVEYIITTTAIGTVQSDSSAARKEIYNISGQKLDNCISNLPAGIYIVKSGNNIQKIRK